MKKVLCETAKKYQDICQHCDKIYFKQFKKFEENFCSLDCKSTKYLQIIDQKEIDNIIDIISTSITF